LLKVSIIIPVYNAEKTIYKTILSCINQTYSNIEILVIDDGSTDLTKEIINSFSDNRIKYFYFENGGRSIARNRGIELITGDYIQFLDADDTIENDKIERAIKILKSDSLIDAVQCGTVYWKNEERVSVQSAKNKKNIDKLLVRKNPFPIHSVLFKKELAAQFPLGLSFCEDWYFWVKTLMNRKVVADKTYYGANVYIHENNTMANYQMMLWGELYILLRIKNEVRVSSVARDIKLLKQYINYVIKYDKSDIVKLNSLAFTEMPILKYIYRMLENLYVEKGITTFMNYKKKIFKKKPLY